ncbi:hypothetical protein ACFVX9_24690 [Kitasatospora sp. NPDC058243]|uniref:hypothetical protein n=1 Tax=Kitasatospora sp. NPDC058243 TaxID=3346397 RepID=UPI0036D8B019
MIVRGDDGAARQVLRRHRQSVLLGAGYLIAAGIELIGVALSGKPYLVVSVIVAVMLPILCGGYLTVRNSGAATRMAEASGRPVAPGTAWGAMTFVLVMLALCGSATVVRQVRDNVAMDTRTTATVTSCNELSRNPHCGGHWTVDGRTYSGNRLAGMVALGTVVEVRYAPGDPTRAVPADESVTPVSIAGGIVIVCCLIGLVPTGLGEWRAGRVMLTEARQQAL